MNRRGVHHWETRASLMLSVTRADRQLTITILGIAADRWCGIAIESSASVQGIKGVVGDHAHQEMPEAPTLVEAMGQAERYARWWQRSRASHEACDCPPIDEAEPAHA